jgi:predicted regulator of Ras-like GTPase activity (Roadblock/LC7/MglB family)
VPFKALLKDLVASAEGASGALLVEADGEAVQWHAETEEDRLRLRAAYVVMALGSYRAAASRAGLGNAGCAILQYEGASFLGQEIERDYFLVLELDPSANVGQALHCLRPAIDGLRRALA